MSARAHNPMALNALTLPPGAGSLTETRRHAARGVDSNTPSGPAPHRPSVADQPWSDRRATRSLRDRAQPSVRSAMSATASRLPPPPPPPPEGAACTVRVTLFCAEPWGLLHLRV